MVSRVKVAAVFSSSVEGPLKHPEGGNYPVHNFLFWFCAGPHKLVETRPPVLAKFLPGSQELGSTSSSEGEKDSPPPEWDSVPVHRPGSCKCGDRGHAGQGRSAGTSCFQRKRGRVCWSRLVPAAKARCWAAVLNVSGARAPARRQRSTAGFGRPDAAAPALCCPGRGIIQKTTLTCLAPYTYCVVVSVNISLLPTSPRLFHKPPT